MHVTFSNGLVLEVTSEHPFYDPRAGDYKPIRELQAGDPVFFLERPNEGAEKGRARQTEVTIKGVETLPGATMVYTLSVEGGSRTFLPTGSWSTTNAHLTRRVRTLREALSKAGMTLISFSRLDIG